MKNPFKLLALAAVVPMAMLASPLAQAGNGADLLKAQCVSCHAVTKPSSSSVERVLSRKGPDLYFAGSKFRREWLEAWLQKPVAIRSGGAMFLNALQPGTGGAFDSLDPAKVPPHPALSAADARDATEALMALRADGLVEPGSFKNEAPNASMAALLFNKLRGCASCHSAKPGAGGVSGAELATAGDRLQPDFIASYLRDPQKFDPHVWMPRLDLNEGDIQKLTAYLSTLKQGAAK
ncbi:c-type cytochrome [Inhella proteolytica]|uniref:C-type cytochrome n=1 Tax=Inhella proteolytica TaxID=2795029 RepID=A0A931J5R3_9BURK|nr:c-type cytochrome [Inhella proteolytica]MBH9578695.1 c-type cytochrome [Inhella proteolytica]